MPNARQPVIYLPHGGGPWPFVDLGPMGTGPGFDALRAWLEGLRSLDPAPRAVLCITAHWEAPVPTVGSGTAPGMLYDYYGFPPASYTITWPAPGEPALAARVRALLDAAGIPNAADGDRGYDHGTFVPLKLAWPDGALPCVQMSLKTGLDPAEHLAIGRALAPLRDEGVLIVGSGMSFHNLRAFGHPQARDLSIAFDTWMQHACAAAPEARDTRLTRWADAPYARACHPREEHLLPLMVVAGAAGSDRGTVPFSAELMGTRVSAVRFG